MANSTPHRRSVPCLKCPLRRLDTFEQVENGDLAFIDTFKRGELLAEKGTILLHEGANSAYLFTVLSGWGFRSKTLPDGRRQILNYAFPGDLIGLQGTIASEMEHSVEAISDMLLCVFQRSDLWTLFREHPELSFDITWLAAREEMLLDANLLSVGRRTARERTAYLILYIFERARSVDMVRGCTMEVPLTQQHIADTLGLSLVHTNKTLRSLQRLGMFEWQNRKLKLVDRERLEVLAKWEGLNDRPRPLI